MWYREVVTSQHVNSATSTMRPTCLALAAFVAAVHGFGVTPHAAADEYACRNKHTPEFVAHAEMIADCVSSGVSTEEECTAELAAMQADDTAGCGAEPVKKSTYTTGGTAPSALCDCCPVEVGESEHKAALCNMTEVAETCAFTCTGSGDDDMASLRRRTLEPLLPTATHIGSAVSAAKQAASSLAANGSWPDIWYGDVSHGANDHWQPASHLSRLSSMVVRYFRQSSACGAQVSPAARHFAPSNHALAHDRMARRGGWRRRDGQLRWRCARLYLCLRAAEVAAGTAGTGHSGCAEREAGVTANAGTDWPRCKKENLRNCARWLAARAPVCNIVEGCCCRLSAGGRAAGIGRAGGSS